MSRCPQAIQEPSRTQQKRARANGGHCLRLGGARAEPLMERYVLHVVAEAPATGNNDDIQRWAVGHRVVREHLHATGGGDYA